MKRSIFFLILPLFLTGCAAQTPESAEPADQTDTPVEEAFTDPVLQDNLDDALRTLDELEELGID